MDHDLKRINILCDNMMLPVPEDDGRAHRTFISAFWVVANHGGQAVIALGVLILLARFLKPYDFAVAAVSFSIVSLFTPIAEGFFNDVILQRGSLGLADLASAWVGSIALGAVLFILLWLSAVPMAALVGLPEVATVLPWMSFTLLIGSLGAVPAAFERRCQRYRTLAVRLVPGRLAGAVVGVAAALLGLGAWSVVVQQVAATAVCTVLVLVGARLRFRPSLFSPSRLRELTRFSLASLTDILILPAYARLATPLISAYLGAEPAAFWNVALRIVDMLYTMIYSAMGHLTMPLLARLQHDSVAVRSVFVACTAVASLIVLPVFAGMAVTAPELVRVLLGEAWIPAVPLVTIFSIISILLLLRQFVLVATTAVGRPGFASQISFQGLVVGLIGLLAGMPFGLAAAAVMSTLRVFPFYIPGAILMQRATGLCFRHQIQPAVAPLLASTLMAAVVLAVREGLLVSMLPPVAVLIGSLLVGIPVYAASAAVLAPGPLRMLLGSFGWDPERGFMARLMGVRGRLQ